MKVLVTVPVRKDSQLEFPISSSKSLERIAGLIAHRLTCRAYHEQFRSAIPGEGYICHGEEFREKEPFDLIDQYRELEQRILEALKRINKAPVRPVEFHLRQIAL